MITDASGNEKARMVYLPYGEISQANSKGTNTITKKFTDQELDEETGLYYYKSRYYDPAIGRYLSPDTMIPNVMDAQSYNRYAYVQNRPSLLKDPTGHWGEGFIPFYFNFYFNYSFYSVNLDFWPYGYGISFDFGPCQPLFSGVWLPESSVGWNGTIQAGYSPSPILPHTGSFWADWYILTGGSRELERLQARNMEAALNLPNLFMSKVLGMPDWRIEETWNALATAPVFAPIGRFERELLFVQKLTRVELAEELITLETRVNEIHGALHPIAQELRTTAILSTEEGVRIVAGGKRDLDPIQRAMLGPGEVAAKLPNVDAEMTALRASTDAGLTPQAMKVTRTICPTCAAGIEDTGGILIDETTAVWPKTE